MNVISMKLKSIDLRVMDLKVCEACGALWLRARIGGGVYCRPCAARLSEFPAPRRRRSCNGARPTGAPAQPGTLVLCAGGAR